MSFTDRLEIASLRAPFLEASVWKRVERVTGIRALWGIVWFQKHIRNIFKRIQKHRELIYLNEVLDQSETKKG
jgi:hypothetical protein